jgi:ubiquinone/menaquinone biosynthesis C-methylase UbiE
MADVLPHNQRAAATWGSGGRDYDRISEFVSDALTHLVNRLVSQSGERFLDVATGTGWTARLLSARGAIVTGIDIGAGVIEAAKALAPDIDFRVGDAEALPFEDASFDAVTSTFGVMFVAQPEIAAREMACVCRALGACDVGARRHGHRHIPDHAALYAATARKPATVSIRMWSP